MPMIIPFRGVLYDERRVPLASVVAPPYDVISPEQQSALYDRHPNNVVRLILGREEDRYRAAAAALGDWLQQGILVRDALPAFYVLHQRFHDRLGRERVRKGFIGLCRIEEFEKKIVLPHEKTLAKPREDRFELFKATHANFSQVFGLYADPEHRLDPHLTAATRRPPAVEVEFEGVMNRMWRLTGREYLHAIQLAMREKQVLIADGHHRYETALAYREWRRSQNPGHTGSEPYNYVMMYLTNMDDEGLVVEPTHRVVHSLPAFDASAFLPALDSLFDVTRYAADAELEQALSSSEHPAFGLRLAGTEDAFLLTLKEGIRISEAIPDDLPPELKELDVVLLHSVILRDMLGITPEAQEQKLNLRYVQGLTAAFDQVRNGSAQLAFALRATPIEQVKGAARAGQTLPQKSTFFYPKLLSGLVLNLMND